MVKGTARQEEEFLLTNIILFEHHCQAGGTPNYASAGPVKRGAKNNPPPNTTNSTNPWTHPPTHPYSHLTTHPVLQRYSSTLYLVQQ